MGSWHSSGSPRCSATGFALAAAPFAATTAARLLRTTGPPEPVTEAVQDIMAGFGDLRVPADVADGLRVLRTVGARVVTLSNGGAEVESLIEPAGRFAPA